MSELIHLEKGGSSVVIVDFLIKGSPGNQVETLRIIYPNRFYRVKRRQKPKVWRIRKTYFSDITTTFLNDAIGINWAYDLPGTKVDLISSGSDTDIPKWATRRIITQPDPTDPTKDIKFDGIVGGNGDLTVDFEEFHPLQLKILYDINCTVMTYKLKQPLGVHARWVRLIFRGENSAHNLHMTRWKRLKSITNQLYHQYQVFGPHDLRHRFITYLLSYKKRCERECTQAFSSALVETLQFFEDEGILGDSQTQASTTFENLFLHIEPGELDRLTDIASQGDAEISGFLPNIVFEKYIHLYQWKAIRPAGKNTLNFSVLFQAKPIFLPYHLVPLVALLIAIAAVVLRFVPDPYLRLGYILSLLK